MNWRIKIIAKIIITNIPLLRKLIELFGLFKLGNMKSFDYSIKIFDIHIKNYQFTDNKENGAMLELGPGLSINSALLGYSYGFKKIYLIDVGDFAIKQVDFYKKFAFEMEKKGYLMPDIRNAKTREEILLKCNAEYLVDGLKSLCEIKSNSLDFVFSHSVLEHIRKNDFISTILELKRIVKKKGISSHIIDYQDHLDKSLNNLRFSEKLWESNTFANSGFYTNRIPAVKIHQYFKNNGFKILKENFGKWSKLPVKKENLNDDFKKFSESELINRTSSLVLIRE